MQPAPAYFLTSPRLGFRHWRDEDLPLAMQLWGDSQVGRFIGGPYSEEKVKERLAEHMAMKSAHGIQYWPMFLLAGGEFVGCAGLRPYKPEENIYELGAHLLPAYWRQGFAKEASETIIEFAFVTLKVGGLFAGHHPENGASRALLGKLGFEYCGEQFYPPTGMIEPTYLLTRSGA